MAAEQSNATSARRLSAPLPNAQAAQEAVNNATLRAALRFSAAEAITTPAAAASTALPSPRLQPRDSRPATGVPVSALSPAYKSYESYRKSPRLGEARGVVDPRSSGVLKKSTDVTR